MGRRDIGLDTETDEGLDAALCESEEEALRQEQAHVHEAVLRSKIDAARTEQILSSDGSADRCPRLILLGFTRCPKEMRCALLESPLAAEMIDKDVELEPEWAEGRLILAEGVTATALSEAREMWHVAVSTVDEDKIYAILK